jgi:hypothetical protein
VTVTQHARGGIVIEAVAERSREAREGANGAGTEGTARR